MKLVTLSQFKKTPWKNGLGLTTEIAIEPHNAKFPNEPFFWRMSCAEVNGKNQFSQFLGYERLLVVWKGDGIILNDKKLLPFEVLKFDGSEMINCELIGSKVLDLGIIFKKDQFNCSMKVLTGSNTETLKFNSKNKAQRFIFLAEGSAKAAQGVAQQEIHVGDIINLEDTASFELVYLSKSRCILIEIEKL